MSPLPSCSLTGPRKSNKNRSTETQVLITRLLIEELNNKKSRIKN